MEWSQSYKADPSKIGFLDLPRELRDYVYRFAFRVPGAIFIYSPRSFTSVKPKVKAMNYRHKQEGPHEPQYLGNTINIALIRVCRQLQAECSPVLYSENVYRVWFLSASDDVAPTYRGLVRHVLYSMQADARIYKDSLDDVTYGWKRRFWPSVVDSGERMLERFPNLETLTIPISPPRYGQEWMPAFFNVKNKTREQRVDIAARWMHAGCPLEHERLRACLHLEVASSLDFTKEQLYSRSRFVIDEDEGPNWDPSEFDEAFQIKKTLP